MKTIRSTTLALMLTLTCEALAGTVMITQPLGLRPVPFLNGPADGLLTALLLTIPTAVTRQWWTMNGTAFALTAALLWHAIN